MRFTVSVESNHVLITFEGLFSIDALKTGADAIRAEIPPSVLSGFILDFTGVSESVGVIEAFEFIRIITAICGDYRRVAIVRCTGPTEGECFCAEVGRCKGVNFEAFMDVDEARAWISKEMTM